MATKIYANARFAHRADIKDNWLKYDPVLEKGEPAIVLDGINGEYLKIGDGEHKFSELPYMLGPKGEKGDKGDKGDTGDFALLSTYDGTSENAVSNKAINDFLYDENGYLQRINASFLSHDESIEMFYPKQAVDEKIGNIELAVIVSELPETATPNKIYMIPKTTTEDANVFDEYLWVNGAWEYIGSIQAQIDLSNYVKKTDFATKSGDAGVVRVGTANGIYISSAGYLQTFPATNSEIDAKTQGYKPIVPKTLDYAVYSAIKDFVTEMSNATTFEQLKAACTNYLNSIT